MRVLLSTLVLIVSALSLQGQIVFESNFDNWNDSLPADWEGVNRVFFADSVTQEAAGTEYGSTSARLMNIFGSPRVMATLGQGVAEGIYYDIEVWVRGYGQIRTGLFDNETSDGDGGFVPWNEFVTIDSDTNVSFVQQVSPEGDYNAGEFLLSTLTGVLTVDRVEVRIGEPPLIPAVSITEIQSNIGGGGISTYQDSTLLVTGTVVAVGLDQYYLQETPGEWGGILVVDFQNDPQIGDNVTVQGTIFEFGGVTQVNGVTDFAVNSSGNTFGYSEQPNNVLNTEGFESCLVRTTGDCILLPSNGFWLMSDGIGSVRVDEFYTPYSPTLNNYYQVTGVMRFFDGSFLIAPRDLDDIVETTGLNDFSELGMALYPNPTSETLVLTLPETIESGVLRFFDMNGRQVRVQNLFNSVEVMDVTDLARGNYNVVFESEGHRASRTLIIN